MILISYESHEYHHNQHVVHGILYILYTFVNQKPLLTEIFDILLRIVCLFCFFKNFIFLMTDMCH